MKTYEFKDQIANVSLGLFKDQTANVSQGQFKDKRPMCHKAFSKTITANMS